MRPLVVAYLNDLFGTDLFQFIVPGYSHMLALGFLLCGWLAVRTMRRQQGLPELPCVIAILLAYVGAMAGSWLFGVLSMGVPYWLEEPSQPWRMFQKGGLVAYGGMIGGFLLPILYLRQNGQAPIFKVLDAGSPYVALGLFFTRIGCFLAGCDFGRVSELPWAMSFPYKSQAYKLHLENGWISDAARSSLPVHPTQLYAALYGLAIFLVFRFWVFPRRKYDGQVFLGVCVTYASLRFLIEFVRGDVSRGLFGPFSTSQWISLAVIGLMAFIYFRVPRPAVAQPSGEGDA